MISKFRFILLLVFFVSTSYYFFEKSKVKKAITKSFNNESSKLNAYQFDKLRVSNKRATSVWVSNLNSNSDLFESYTLLLKTRTTHLNSALVNIPKKPGIYPVALLLRGYVDKEIYSPGIGSQRIGEYLAQNGFVTIAPDFLGYGKSSKASRDSLEERFQTYTTTLSFLDSINQLNTALKNAGIKDISVDTSKVVIWGHSNGGHIALSVLAITGKKYPTVLWAPVSKPFPYSILYFTDEYPDNGKYLRKIIADFESKYDIEKYNPVNYYKWIKAPIQIHHGTLDDAVPLKWSIQLDEKLRNLHIDSELYTYESADHNLMPYGWNEAALRTLNFFRSTKLDHYENK